jgi:ankyrin repeat protein
MSDRLHEAAYAGDLATVRALLDGGADPNRLSDSPLFISAAS